MGSCLCSTSGIKEPSLLKNDGKQQFDYDTMSISSVDPLDPYQGIDPVTFIGKRSKKPKDKKILPPKKECKFKYHQNALLVHGYIRLNCKYFISDLVQLCILYHQHWTELVSFHDKESEWFTNSTEREIDIFQHEDIVKYPLTQYIYDKYQIVFVSIPASMRILWKGFLCVNMQNHEVYQLTCQLPCDKNPFHISLSEALQLSNPDSIYFSKRSQWLKPAKPNNMTHYADTSSDSLIRCEYEIWKDFEYGLWDLFVNNQLFNGRLQKIEEQGIWKVIQFLAVIKYEYEHGNRSGYAGFTLPTLILSGSDCPDNYFPDLMNRYYETIYYENFNVFKDCNAMIDEYEKDERLRCHCYLYVDWGEGYWFGLGNRRVLYRARFEISKLKDRDVIVKFECDVIATQEGGGL